jgi:hypothetical protein
MAWCSVKKAEVWLYHDAQERQLQLAVTGQYCDVTMSSILELTLPQPVSNASDRPNLVLSSIVCWSYSNISANIAVAIFRMNFNKPCVWSPKTGWHFSHGYLHSYYSVIIISLTPCNIQPWEADSRSTSQEIPRLFSNLKFHYIVPNNPLVVLNLSKMNPAQAIISYFFKTHPNIIHPSTPRSPKWLSLQVFRPKNINYEVRDCDIFSVHCLRSIYLP